MSIPPPPPNSSASNGDAEPQSGDLHQHPTSAEGVSEAPVPPPPTVDNDGTIPVVPVGTQGQSSESGASWGSTAVVVPPLPNPQKNTSVVSHQLKIASLVGVVAIVMAAASGMIGYRIGADGAGTRPENYSNLPAVLDLVEDNAVDDPDEELLVEAAVDGLLEELDDPYAVYYNAERFARLNADLDGEFVGVGVLLEEKNDGIFIGGVLPDSPAEDAGIETGERITSVNGTSVLDGATSRDLIDLIAGDEGDERTIGLDSGSAGPREVTVQLRKMEIPQVVARQLDSGIGYVALAQFSRNAEEELRAELETFKEQGVPGIILDLRGNPGGLLDESVDIASLFMEEGVVVRVDMRDSSEEHLVSGDAVVPDIPLVVLIDGNSASASEILAGALQDAERAPIVGQTSYGKGTVQVVYDLDGGAGVKFTTARYYTPSGDSINGVGVVPDVEVVTEEPADGEGDDTEQPADPVSEDEPATSSDDPILKRGEEVLLALIAGEPTPTETE